MKKFIAVVAAIITIAALTGCSGKSERPESSVSNTSVAEEPVSSSDKYSEISSDISSDTSSDVSSESTASNEEEIDELYASRLPNNDEMFPGDEIKIVDSDGGTEYSFWVKDYKDGEYEAYVEKCKETNFTKPGYSHKNDDGYEYFDAYTDDGLYFIVVEKVPNQGVIRVRTGRKTD